MVLPAQIAVSGNVETDGWGFTIIFTESSATHPLLYATCTTYTVDDNGLADGLGEDGLLNPVTGSQLYVTPGEAMLDSCTVLPAQITASPEAATEGDGFTVMLTESVAKHLPLLAVMVYLVSTSGVA